MQWLIDIITETVLNSMSGIISIWHGLLADIPDGWVLCDGTNGTPNLSTKFILGSIFDAEVGQTGGALNHNHPFTSNTHHHHTTPTVTADGVTEGDDVVGTTQGDPATSDDVATGTTDNIGHLPPYYRVAFIMKT